MNEAAPSTDERMLDLFLRALDRDDPHERARFLDAECASDPALRRLLEAELRKQTGSGSDSREVVLKRPSSDSTNTPEVEALLAALKPEEAGDTIGPYTLREQLGEGGFGVVWMAEQERPVRRQVALKILKLGMNSKQIIGRFEQERQTLAMLDHPGIAKVLDAGATTTGRPFFVMELVRGEPITDFCDAARLPVRARLELMMRVCYALQHAHQKGIIHRDLKPTNILVVRLEDGPAVPKIIDLGLAKATLEMPTEHTLIVTQEDRMLGTPLYMSPEQAEGSLDVDTRTDIYSLGVILYELLTGRTPHDANAMARRANDEIRRAIREEDPPRPSSALRAMAEGPLTAAAQQRGVDAPHLLRRVRGELDAICMKALEKDRRRRYAAAVELAADLQHHLLHEPITARAPSQWYRARKFARRNQRAITTVAAIVAALLLGSFVSLREAVRAKHAEQNARAAQENEAQHRALAEEQRERAERARASARLNEYIADIGLAQQSLNAGNLGRAVQLLEKHRPAAAEADQRGWGWRYLWQLAQGDPHLSFPDHPGPAGALAFSPGGDFLTIGGQQHVTVCDAKSRELLATLSPGADSLAFVMNGQMLIAVSNGRLHLWRTDDWSEYGVWPDVNGPIALSADGALLAMAGGEGVRILETNQWKDVRLLEGARGPLAFSPDGRTLATDASAGLTLWPVALGQPRVLANSRGVFARVPGAFFQPSQPLVFAENGGAIVVIENGPTERGVFLLRVWDERTGDQVALLPDAPERTEHTGAITSLAISPDGHTLATTSLDHSVRLWDLAKRRRIATLHGHHAEVGASAFSPDGQTLITSDRAGRVKAWAVRQETPEDVLTEAARPLAFSHDGRTLAALMSDGTIAFCDATTKEIRWRGSLELSRSGRPPIIAISGDLRTLVEALGDGSVRIWNTETGEARTERIATGRIEQLALTPDGETLIFGNRGEPLHSRHLHTGAEIELPFAAARLVMSPDGQTLAAFLAADAPPDSAARAVAPTSIAEAPPVTAQPEVRRARPRARGGSVFPPASRTQDSVVLWDLRAGAIRARLEVETGMPLDAAFSPDGRTFATAGTDNAIRLWATESGALLGVCYGHKQIVRAIAFGYDGTTLASASEDSTLRFWNVATQQELLSFQELGTSMSSLLFSPDDRTLAVATSGVARARKLRFYRAPLLGETCPVSR